MIRRAEAKRLYNRHEAALEDFWGRRENGPRYQRPFTLFGRPALATSNHEGVLTAVDQSLPLYSTAPPADAPPLLIRFVVRDAPLDPGPPPQNLLAINQYVGHGDWLAIQTGGWGHVHIDLAAGQATAVLTPQLAARPDLVSRGLLNTIFNNLLTGQGWAMLHCSGLWRDGRLLLLMAPHNSGKSTTAFRLIRAGYQLISDSQIYVAPDSEPVRLFGFPVGRIKLRADMVPHFPGVRDALRPEPVRDEVKYMLDLRRRDVTRVVTTAVAPEIIDLCLLRRHDRPETALTPATEAEVWEAVMANSLYYDAWAGWASNLVGAARLIDCARAHHLAIGTDAAGIVAAVDEMMTGGRP